MGGCGVMSIYTKNLRIVYRVIALYHTPCIFT